MSIIPRRALIAAALLPATAALAQDVTWRALRPGMSHARLRTSAAIGDGQLDALRFDPARCRFRLLASAATGDAPRTARQWAREHNLLAAINAGMFGADGRPVGYAKADGHVIQPTLSRDRSVFVFTAGRARLIDREQEDFAPADHANALQSIRMVSHSRRNVWTQQPRIWSTAALAQDADGAILFLHMRSPLSVHDFTAFILSAPLRLERAMYLEGGPEATLYARGDDGGELERFGSYETGFNENDDNDRPWPLPNILGVLAR